MIRLPNVSELLQPLRVLIEDRFRIGDEAANDRLSDTFRAGLDAYLGPKPCAKQALQNGL